MHTSCKPITLQPDLSKTCQQQHPNTVKPCIDDAYWNITATCCIGWLEERLETLYKPDPGYSDKASSMFTLDLQSPQELPDNLRGEQWNFVQLPLSDLMSELEQVKQVRQLPNKSTSIYIFLVIPSVLF